MDPGSGTDTEAIRAGDRSEGIRTGKAAEGRAGNKEAWITTETFFPESYDTALEIQDDLPISIDENSICWHGTQYSILHAMDRCFVIPERYLMPIWSDQMHLFMRIMPKTGEMKIIAKEGLFISAIFGPVKAEQELREWLIKTNNAIW